MRNTLFAMIVALFLSIYAADAIAAPITAFLAIGGLSATVAASTYIANLVVGTLIAVGTSLLLQELLQPERPTTAPPDRFVNPRVSVPDRQKSYGVVRVGGPVYFWEDAPGKRYVGVVINTGEIDSFVSWFLGEREVTLDADGFVQEEEYQSEDRSRVQIVGYAGDPYQTSPQLLLDNFEEWTAEHDLRGCAHVVMVCENAPQEDFQTIYPSSREPQITPVIRGTKCYDPRTGLTEWTRNAALIIADWITDTDGLNREVDWDIVSVEAEHCDSLVKDSNGNSVEKWQLSGTYSFSEARETVRASMAVACDAFFFETSDGKVGFRVGRWIEPSVTITDDHLLSVTLVEGQDGTALVNSQTVIYTSFWHNYREHECAPYQIDDGQPYYQDTIQGYWIPNHNQASRVAKRMLLAKRSGYRVSLRLNLAGFQLRGQRFFRLILSELSLDLTMEVDSLKISGDGLTVEVEAHYAQQSDFEFDSATEESAEPQPSSIASDVALTAPTDVAARDIPVSGGGGAIRVSWSGVSDFHSVEVRFKRDVDSVWTSVSAPQGALSIDTPTLVDGWTYDIQARAKNAVARVSDWAPETPLSVEVNPSTAAPSQVTNEAVNLVSGTSDVLITWDNPSSENFAGVNVYRDDDAGFTGSTLIAFVPGIPDGTGQYLDEDLDPDQYWYWTRAVNTIGTEQISSDEAGDVIVS